MCIIVTSERRKNEKFAIDNESRVATNALYGENLYKNSSNSKFVYHS